jgi:hypothetical protein
MNKKSSMSDLPALESSTMTVDFLVLPDARGGEAFVRIWPGFAIAWLVFRDIMAFLGISEAQHWILFEDFSQDKSVDGQYDYVHTQDGRILVVSRFLLTALMGFLKCNAGTEMDRQNLQYMEGNMEEIIDLLNFVEERPMGSRRSRIRRQELHDEELVKTETELSANECFGTRPVEGTAECILCDQEAWCRIVTQALADRERAQMVRSFR